MRQAAPKGCVAGIALAMFLVAGAGAAPRLSVLYTFDDADDGNEPQVQAIDDAGNLYGSALFGGGLGTCSNGGCGTLFKLAPDGTKTDLHVFSGADGSEPTGIVRDAGGTIYGTSLNGGVYGYGAVFKLTPDGQASLLYSFPAPDRHNDAPNGIWPTDGLILGYDGNLYGTTWHGGINRGCGTGGCGAVFKLTPSGQFHVVYAFAGKGDGCASYSRVTMDRAGNLYGTTQGCGHGNYGTVYKIDPGGAETVLHVFKEGLDGNNPISVPVLDEAGNLYGGTVSGGGTGCGGRVQGPGCGILYKIAPDGTETILHAFQGPIPHGDGAIVSAGLYREKDGTLYGTTKAGGAGYACYPLGCGTVFKLTPDGTVTILHKFLGRNAKDGGGADFALIPGRGKDRRFFYSSTDTGPNCCGEIFKIRR